MYKVQSEAGEVMSTSQPNPSAANRSAKMWANTMHKPMQVVVAATGEVRFTVQPE